MDKIKILWADDEITLLKPHILFLNDKGYEVITAMSGDEALDIVKENKALNAVLLDENMPGLSGLDTLLKIKQVNNDLPVIMITKSEEEHIMNEAIGGKIADYLIKPVNPNQILLSLKKALDNKRLVSEKTNTDYRKEFGQIGMTINDNLSWQEWIEVYKKIIYWELEMDKLQDKSMLDVLKMQKSDANTQFFKFVEKNYINWVNGKNANPPVMSHTLFKNKFLKELVKDEPVFLLLIDNLRLDQWKVIQPIIQDYYQVETEEAYYSILPTATQYSRNAIFSGLMPSEMEKMFPNFWLNDEEEGGKNMHEEAFLQAQLKRLGKDIKMSYNKITNFNAGKKLSDNLSNLLQNKLNVIVYNFVDMLSHARTEMEVIRELAENETSYRSITKSWFEHSPLFDIIKQLADKKIKVVITTDHGTVHVKEPTKILGDKNVNSNLRYKQGKALEYNYKEVFEIKNPADAYLPIQHPSSRFVFAREDRFFAYPNNFNHYVNYYKNTFQHGGVSLEEVIIPYIVLTAK
ncbi:MAG: bifunctional response regulator/alkaline phosphatase family protein [Bacteroidota bacterium]|nr:bifunctional response regulator/alkaline phosphatase family protein [Bacteroidota bacterium]MDP3147273.1 bifunctional response regulator/alkaline phosphatase family protein [Bacteroidota bacterium]MDP3557353.1 bifunctional response regulator/alkaline phosphatase family protein [Bacteroidota bacterium]